MAENLTDLSHQHCIWRKWAIPPEFKDASNKIHMCKRGENSQGCSDSIINSKKDTTAVFIY